MALLNVWIPCYDDLDQLREAIWSTVAFEGSVDVYVVDGRYATFPGETDTTPGADEFCEGFDHVTYTTPPRLPINATDEERFRLSNACDYPPKYLRLPQHEQAKWVNYQLLPENEWALEMDTDERLKSVEFDGLESLDPQKKYVPTVWQPDGTQLTLPIRLYQPRWWTFWIDDVMFWRQWYPRDTPVEDIFNAHRHSSHRGTNYGGVTGVIEMENMGTERDQEYQERRAVQLEEMGAPFAARAVRDGKQPSMVELEDYIREGEEVKAFQEVKRHG